MIDATVTSEVENLTEEISRMQAYIDRYLPVAVGFCIRLLLALLVFFIGSKLIRLLRKVVRRSLERTDAELGVIQFLDSLLKIALYFILIMLLASGFGIDTASVIALVGSAGLAVGLAMQGYLENFAGGVLILLIKPFRVGDYIIQGDLEGTVSEIEMVYTSILTADNRKIVIPNGKLANNSLMNVTAEEKRRLDIEVGIAYQADLKKAREICEAIMKRDERILDTESQKVVVSELAESSVVLKVMCWVQPADYWNTRWDTIEAIKKGFDENGVEIPFNQLDVTIKQK